MSLVDAPLAHLAFASLHLLAGQGLASLQYRLRYGGSPLVLYTARESVHQRISRGVGAASVAWAATLAATALWPALAHSLLGRPLLALPDALGFAVAAPALAAMCAAQASMGAAFRVGQDDLRAPEALRTGGAHAWSRNPIYAASWLALGGMTLWWPSALLVGAWLAVGIGIHGLVLAEERFLAERFPEDFARYRARVPRYLGRPR